MWDICDTKVYLGFNASLFPIIKIWKKVEDPKDEEKEVDKDEKNIIYKKKKHAKLLLVLKLAWWVSFLN
jgi:hypothetical protein